MGKSKLRLGSSTLGTKEPCVNRFLKIEWQFHQSPSGSMKEKGRKTPAVHANNKIFGANLCVKFDQIKRLHTQSVQLLMI